MTLRYSVVAVKYNDFLNLEIERYSKVIIDCYNQKISLLNLIILLIEDT